MAFLKEIRTSDRFAGEAGEIKVEKLDYNVSDRVIYRGVNASEHPDEGDLSWYIAKYTWSGENLVQTEYRSGVAWADRAELLGGRWVDANSCRRKRCPGGTHRE